MLRAFPVVLHSSMLLNGPARSCCQLASHRAAYVWPHLGVTQTLGYFFSCFCPPSNRMCGLPPGMMSKVQKQC
jgi:hypothetical protein